MNSIDIYALDLRNFDASFLDSDRLLQMQASEYQSSYKRQEYLASAWLRRFVLKQYVQAQDIVFETTEKGRPFLKDHSNYDFNISHTQNYMVMAVVKEQKIGIDIQWSQQRIDVLDIAEKYYAQHEYQWLKTLPAYQINYYFYLLWTLKEASLKWTGDGISFGLERYAFIYKHQKLRLSDSCTIRPYYYSRHMVDRDILLSLATTNPILPIRYFTVTEEVSLL